VTDLLPIETRIRDIDNPEYTGTIVEHEVPEHGGGYYVRWDHMPADVPAEWTPANYVLPLDAREDLR